MQETNTGVTDNKLQEYSKQSAQPALRRTQREIKPNTRL
jgi:hypothetical protein